MCLRDGLKEHRVARRATVLLHLTAEQFSAFAKTILEHGATKSEGVRHGPSDAIDCIEETVYKEGRRFL